MKDETRMAIHQFFYEVDRIWPNTQDEASEDNSEGGRWEKQKAAAQSGEQLHILREEIRGRVSSLKGPLSNLLTEKETF